ncbi:MAG: DUF47 domain-containing protein [Candidatus Omnitrophica bacterium]|nr:DUF47 domain-containing protein [Candidatus Omnitrophota bacterium]
MFWKKQKEIEAAVDQYIKETENCIELATQAFEVYFSEGLGDKYKGIISQVHQSESKADDQRREIERTMYGKALIPASRGDILGMLEALDQIPNKFDSVLHQIDLQSMSVPAEYIDKMKQHVAVNIESYHLLIQGARSLFADMGQVLSAMDKVDAKESESDKIERQLIKSIFDSSMDKADKILLKELVLEIGSISDRAENAADRISIIAIKQQV